MTSSGLPSTYQYTAKESGLPHPLISEWLKLHKAEKCNWRHYGRDGKNPYYTRCEFPNGHIVALTAWSDPDRVLFAYAGPRTKDGDMGQRSYREFEPGEYREQTEETLRGFNR